ncbi:GDP-mannose 4,6-dehydratase [Patescibacteria group bacterium]|nr:GDP-mannose 4,6-dehydratase [Patescibacteria group bacterium]
MAKKALVTGITGQDGSYLAEFLLKKGYDVFGLERRASTKNRGNIKHIESEIHFISGDMLDSNSLIRAISEAQPDEIYNLAAQSFVAESWHQKRYTHEVNSSGVINLLEAVYEVKPDAKVYQAGTSEMFGKVQETPQKETTPFYPRSPYGIAKLAAYWTVVNFRESYSLFACSGLLFNHESPRRGLEFVTRKITNAVVQIKLGLIDKFFLGNIGTKRDWGFAGDYVAAMWLMLQQNEPDDFVIATGKTNTVRKFVELAFEAVNIKIESNGKKGVDEKYIRTDTGSVVLEINSKFFRPAEVYLLMGDSSKARKKLGWKPKVNFEELVRMMVKSDLKLLSKK